MTQFKPFALASADQFLADIPPPPPLKSMAWAINFNLTKTYGEQNSAVRTAAQTEIGRFWTDDAAAQYSRAFRSLVASQGLSTVAAARLAAMYSVAASDAVTACMNAKYHFAFWRPYTAIHDADTDANRDTVADPNWVPLAVTPGHPEYPANHGCVTQAVMDALTAFFDTDEIPYSVTSAVTGTTHSFNSFEDVVTEVDNARTAAQTEIGRFWTDDAAAQYSRAFRALVASQRLSTAAAARLAAMYSVAASDAVTACMNAKYHFAFWRPYTAIHDADTDANRDTVADPNWVPLAVTPGHPEYPANHGCVTQAVMDALTAFFGTDEIPYSVTSAVTQTTHSFNSFEDVVTEVDDARIYGGMHYRHSVKQGNRLGRLVTEYMLRGHFKSNDR